MKNTSKNPQPKDRENEQQQQKEQRNEEIRKKREGAISPKMQRDQPRDEK